MSEKIIKFMAAVVLGVCGALAATAISLFFLKDAAVASATLSSVPNQVSSVTQVAQPEPESEPEPEPEIQDNGIGLEITSPQTTSLNTRDSVVAFTGSSDPAEPLTLNGGEVERSADGIFALERNLNIGKNYFTFKHKGKTVTYTVNYRYVVIDGYAPWTDQIYSSGSTFTVSVYARKGSAVTASFNGQTIELTPSDSEDSESFINYFGSFTLPSDNFADLALGKITYSATFEGKNETFKSGDITCKKADIVVDFDPNATPLGGQYINVGSGKIAEIVDYQAETFDAYSTNDWSRPTNSYLPKGTVDYSAQGYVYYGDQAKEYAVLRCGKQIYTKRADKPYKEEKAVIREYVGVLPDHNEITVAGFENTGRHTVLTLDTLWKAPFYFEVRDQQYNNPQKQDYVISDVTFNCIDITFCYATVFTGEIVLEDNPIFQSAVILKNQSDYTLRLTLKKQGAFYGWDSYYNDAGQLIFEFLNPAKITQADNGYGVDLNGAVILIDVGHGGIDCGATGFDFKNHSEAIQNLVLANKIKAELESMGATVHLTRSENITSSTDDKLTLIKKLKPDYCIAIHHNSSQYSSPNGFSSHYFHAFSKKAAEYVYNHTSNTGIYNSSSLLWHYYFMARATNCPVVLTENGYMSNIHDYHNIIDDGKNILKAKAIVKGIAEYFSSIQ